MLTRFYLWLFIFINQWFNSEQNIKPKTNTNSDVLVLLNTIQTTLNQLPDTVRIDSYLDPFLLNQIDSKFKDVGHIFDYFTVYKEGIGEQLNDPSILIAPDDNAVINNIVVSRTISLAHFQTQAGVDITLKETFIHLEKEIEILVLLYTQILFHPNIDIEYRPFLDKKLNRFLSELERYIDAINTHGQSHVSRLQSKGRHL